MDSEFFEECYLEKLTLTVGDSDYCAEELLIEGNKAYVRFVNIDDLAAEYLFRRLAIIDGAVVLESISDDECDALKGGSHHGK